MKNLNLVEDMRRYYGEIFDKIGIMIPLDGNNLVEESKLKEEKELTVLVDYSFFNSINSVLKFEEVYQDLVNGIISEEEYFNKLNSCPSYLHHNPLVCDIENSDLKIQLTTCINDDEHFGVIGTVGVSLVNKNKYLLNTEAITDIKVFEQGIPFSFNNYYCSSFITEDGKEYLSKLNHGYRIKFSII